VYHLDVKSAFLNGYLDEEVFVAQPQGFKKEGRENHVYKLKKVLYGLKQAPWAWYSCIDGYFQNLGFTRSKSEPTLYYKHDGVDILLIFLYVDDLIYMGTNSRLNYAFRNFMMQEFEMKILGLMHYFLGLEVYEDDSQIFIAQTKYANDFLHKFGMDDYIVVITPIAYGEYLTKEYGISATNVHTYKSIVGSLIFLTNSRLDICHVILLVSRYISAPSKIHLKVAKWILRYVKGTLDFGIHYLMNKVAKLIRYSDSD